MKIKCEECGKVKDLIFVDYILSFIFWSKICYECDEKLDYTENLEPILRKYLKPSVFK